MIDTWNPWHGCRKISDGCKNCYVYRRDAQYDIDSTAVVKNKTFYAPAERYKYGNYKTPAIILMHDCMTKTTTVEALSEIIKFLKNESYTFKTLK